MMLGTQQQQQQREQQRATHERACRHTDGPSATVGRRRTYGDFAYDYDEAMEDETQEEAAQDDDDDDDASMSEEDSDSDEDFVASTPPPRKLRKPAGAAPGTGSDTSASDRLCLQQAEGTGARRRARRARPRRGAKDPHKSSRVAANRRSAQRSRQRKLQHAGELERAIEELRKELQEAKPQLAALHEKEQLAMQRNRQLRQRLKLLGANPPAAAADAARPRDQHQKQPQQQPEGIKVGEAPVPVLPGGLPFKGDLLDTMHAAICGVPLPVPAAAAPDVVSAKPALVSFGSIRSKASSQASKHHAPSRRPAGSCGGAAASGSDDSAGARQLPVLRARAQRTQFLKPVKQQQQQADADKQTQDVLMEPAPSLALLELPLLDTSRTMSLSRCASLPLVRSATLEAAVQAASSQPPTPRAGVTPTAASQWPMCPHALRADALEAALNMPPQPTSPAATAAASAFQQPPVSPAAAAAAGVSAFSQPTTPAAGTSGASAFATSMPLAAAANAAGSAPTNAPAASAPAALPSALPSSPQDSTAAADSLPIPMAFSIPLSRSATLEAALADATAPTPPAAAPSLGLGLLEEAALALVQRDIDSGLVDLGLAGDPMLPQQLGSEVTAVAAAAADAARSSGGDPVTAQLEALEQATSPRLGPESSAGSDAGMWAATSARAPGGSWSSYRSANNSISSSSNVSGYGDAVPCSGGSITGSISGMHIGSPRHAGAGSGNLAGARAAQSLALAPSGPLLVDNVAMPGFETLDALTVA